MLKLLQVQQAEKFSLEAASFFALQTIKFRRL